MSSCADGLIANERKLRQSKFMCLKLSKGAFGKSMEFHCGFFPWIFVSMKQFTKNHTSKKPKKELISRGFHVSMENFDPTDHPQRLPSMET